MNKPNLFSWANKELEQDAFLCWLITWAKPSNKKYDVSLNAAGQIFVKELLKTHNIQDDEIIDISLKKQYKRGDIAIDIVVKVTTEKQTVTLVIEDKVNANDYNNLKKYLEKIENDKTYQNTLIKGVFIKTKNQATYSKVLNCGYSIFLRKDFLRYFDLTKTLKITNNIFLDFQEHLIEIDENINSYLTKNIGDWNRNSWIGFYEYLQTKTKFKTWGYVSNPNGGFLSSNWVWNDMLRWKDYVVFLQIEEDELCFKVGEVYGGKGNRSSVRNELYRKLMSEVKQLNHNEIKKPKRFGNGCYMTIAKVDKKSWLGEQDTIVDVQKVINKLIIYEKLVENIIK